MVSVLAIYGKMIILTKHTKSVSLMFLNIFRNGKAL